MAFNHIRRACKPNDRRFTLDTTVEQIKKLVRVSDFDLDAAAEELSHVAPVWYGPGGAAEDGLETPWFGHVFCNPPWSQKGLWVAKGWREMDASRTSSIAMLLPATTDQAWWHEYVEPRRGIKFLSPSNTPYVFDVHFLPGRPRYGCPEDPTGAMSVCSVCEGAPMRDIENRGCPKCGGTGLTPQSSPPFGSCVLVWATA